MELHEVQTHLTEWLSEAASAFQKVPGSAVLIRYVRSSYQNDPVRSAIELILVIFFIRYLLAPSYSTSKQNFIKLTEADEKLTAMRLQEIDELVDEWVPEPLVAPLTALEEIELERAPVIVGPTGPKVKLANGRTVTNLATYNFYNLNANEQIKEKAIQTFYATQDVHMRTEADIAAFIGTEGCITYAQSFVTISSLIPAFCKRGDIIVADRAVNLPIRRGLEASRSIVKWFNHGDLNDLELVMQKIVRAEAKKKLTRRFIVTEGLFETTGEINDLPKLIELKQKYKFRLILDESSSFGVLGRTGRGLTEAQNVDPSQVDMIVGSMAGPLCAGGGFCAGDKDMVEHQRIMAAGYTFSAALPATVAMTASESLNILQSNPEILVACRENIRLMRAQLDPRSDWVMCTSAPENPVVFLVFKPDVVKARMLTVDDQQRLLQECVDESLANGVLITKLKGSPITSHTGLKGGEWTVQPALKVCVTSGLSKKEIEKAGTVIRHAITKVMTRKTNNKLGLPAA
ncbi:pyridoxal phosphate-dependent transferase [Cercophora scortea]|uniref:serine C-palmitoyltransferase n=1 Tax=Cercophora scortea TaxID=314031 RepID=A0AAE0I7D1_9PEZI|nr:pyridoxal phosphate-dependent transferase [Cercophora scortea]